MTDFAIINKLTTLPDNLKKEVEDFIDFLKIRSAAPKANTTQRVLGLAKGMITIKKGFDDPIADFNEYM